jgi:hypothetical protein
MTFIGSSLRVRISTAGGLARSPEHPDAEHLFHLVEGESMDFP